MTINKDGTPRKKRVERLAVKPNINIKTVYLDPAISYGQQLKAIRKIKGITYRELSELTNMELSNIHHLEWKKGPFKSDGNYITPKVLLLFKALGVQQLIIKL